MSRKVPKKGISTRTARLTTSTATASSPGVPRISPTGRAWAWHSSPISAMYKKASGPQNFVEKFVLSDVEHFVNADYKTLLQEKLATIDKKSKLEYGLIGSSGPSHQLTFEMGIYFNDELILTAKGKSKKEAEQLCAKLFLEKLEKTT